MIINKKKTLVVVSFTVTCLRSPQTTEPGLQLQPVSKVTGPASFPHFCLRHCLICEPFIWIMVEAWRQFVIITDWSWHIPIFCNIWPLDKCSFQGWITVYGQVFVYWSCENLCLFCCDQSKTIQYPIIMSINHHIGVQQCFLVPYRIPLCSPQTLPAPVCELCGRVSSCCEQTCCPTQLGRGHLRSRCWTRPPERQ